MGAIKNLARGIIETTTVQEFIVEEQTMHIHNRQTENTKISCCFIEVGGMYSGLKGTRDGSYGLGNRFPQHICEGRQTVDETYHCLKSLFEERVQVNKRSVII